MKEFVCTLTYPDGALQTDWKPHKPTEQDACAPADTIAFVSPDVDTLISFQEESPFGGGDEDMSFTATAQGTDAKTVAETARGRTFRFDCFPDAIISDEGDGDTIKVKS